MVFKTTTLRNTKINKQINKINSPTKLNFHFIKRHSVWSKYKNHVKVPSTHLTNNRSTCHFTPYANVRNVFDRRKLQNHHVVIPNREFPTFSPLVSYCDTLFGKFLIQITIDSVNISRNVAVVRALHTSNNCSVSQARIECAICILELYFVPWLTCYHTRSGSRPTTLISR